MKKGDGLIVILIYVDDMIVTINNDEVIVHLKYLHTQIDMKDLGELKYFLCLEVLRWPQRIIVWQTIYALDLLKETGNINCKPLKPSMAENLSYLRLDNLRKNLGKKIIGWEADTWLSLEQILSIVCSY